jgi:hypothetical protein
MSRAQLSVMIIIGLVIVILVGIGYYIVGVDKEFRSESGLKQAQLAPEIVRPVEQFTDGCFRVAVTEALRTLGQQGGVLYRSQGGLVDDTSVVERREVLTVEGTRVWYGLHRPEGQVGDLYFATAPDYPWQTFPMLAVNNEGVVDRIEDFRGFYGFERLPSLNGTIPSPALPSIEEMLSAAIATNVQACLDWSRLDVPVNVTSGEPRVDVLINSEDTTFILNASIVIETPVGRSMLRFSSFRTPVRLARLYDAVKLVLGLDGNDISMSIDSIDTGMIAHTTVPMPGTNDDLIVFIDNTGKLEGTPYEFVTARQSRLPALAFIEDPGDSINLCQGATIRRQEGHLTFSAAACDEDGKSGRVPRADERYPEFRCWSPGEKELVTQVVLVQGEGREEEIADGGSYAISELDNRAGNMLIRIRCSEVANPESKDWQDVGINVAARPKPQP